MSQSKPKSKGKLKDKLKDYTDYKDYKEINEEKKEAYEEEDYEDEENGFEINYHLYESLKETFELELFKIFKNITKKYGEEYMFDQQDLINFYKGYNLEIFYKKTSNHHKKNKNIELPDEERCCGRVWAGGYMDENQYGDRCQRKKINNSDYCKQHTEKLVHGRFDGEPSHIVKGFFVKQNDKSREYELDTDNEGDESHESHDNS